MAPEVMEQEGSASPFLLCLLPIPALAHCLLWPLLFALCPCSDALPYTKLRRFPFCHDFFQLFALHLVTPPHDFYFAVAVC